METFTFSDRGVDWTIEFEPRRTKFNDGPGFVSTDAARTIASVTERQPWQHWIVFTSRRQTNPRDPAWNFEADANIRYQVPPGTTIVSQQDPGISRQEWGFIQTILDLRYSAQYDNLSVQVAISNKRDVNPLSAGVPAPWYSIEGRDGGPQALVPPPNTTGLSINDAPQVTFRSMGHRTEARNPLRRIEANGRFALWLVVKHRDDPGNRIDSLRFLYNWVIVFNRSWEFIGRRQPTDRPSESSFRPAGSQFVQSSGQGRGSETPVLNGTPAYEVLRTQMSALDSRYPRSR